MSFVIRFTFLIAIFFNISISFAHQQFVNDLSRQIHDGVSDGSLLTPKDVDSRFTQLCNQLEP